VTRRAVTAWNRWPVFEDQAVVRVYDRDALLPPLARPFIAHGNGRSYSDVCLNEGGFLLDTRGLDRFIAFDHGTGRLRCEAGVLLRDIVALVVPQGWFLPVTPGTLLVTVGGAIANDVHGKNHHVAGSFGRHVTQLALRRSDGRLLVCGPQSEPGWFAATVGGLGLTGVILWAEIQLMPMPGATMVMRTRRFRSLDEFWSLNAEAGAQWPYTVAWVDCLAGGRGLLFCGRHAPAEAGAHVKAPGRSWRIGFSPPVSLVNRWSARLFNGVYYGARSADREALCHYRRYFYPLDRIEDWNRLYGPRGFFQYQCVLPPPAARATLAELLARIAESGEASFLAVLKTFGEFAPAGLLSFARPGTTLAVDFPNRGERTARLLADLDELVLAAGGALYPAKDARMPARSFRAGYPRLAEFMPYVDPKISSSFWRRVSA
jgi:FAD/FMN-containing dehydrogenase